MRGGVVARVKIRLQPPWRPNVQGIIRTELEGSRSLPARVLTAVSVSVRPVHKDHVVGLVGGPELELLADVAPVGLLSHPLPLGKSLSVGTPLSILGGEPKNKLRKERQVHRTYLLIVSNCKHKYK